MERCRRSEKICLWATGVGTKGRWYDSFGKCQSSGQQVDHPASGSGVSDRSNRGDHGCIGERPRDCFSLRCVAERDRPSHD